jgi:hypothetical protein
MNEMTRSNVFYLPTPVPAIEPRRVAPRRTALRAALGRTWRRLRVSIADIRAVLTEREPVVTGPWAPIDDARLDSPDRPHRRGPGGPGRIVHLAEARRSRTTPTP